MVFYTSTRLQRHSKSDLRHYR
nr:hypothetical protein [Vibrio harveyi]